MKIYKLMKEPNQAATDAAIEAMVKDFNDRPELSVELYWIAFGYEEYPDKMPQAEKIYERIIKECPGTEEADKAQLGNNKDTCDNAFLGTVDPPTGMLGICAGSSCAYKCSEAAYAYYGAVAGDWNAYNASQACSCAPN